MKLLGKNFSKHGEGDITLVPENEEDIWMVYNLLQVGDSIRASTVRKVHNESMTGSVAVKQVRLNLTISVESITYDSLGGTLHLKGRNLEENKHVKLGAYHTLDIAINDKFTLRKPEWDTVAVDLVEEACDPTRQADVAAVVMQEGLAHVCLITPSTTLVRGKIDLVIPKKRGDGKVSQHKKGMERFYSQVMQAIERHVKFDIVKCVILASPGFLKDELFQYIMHEATQQEKRVFLENRGKFILVHSTSGHKHALQEVLSDPACSAKLADTKAAGEVGVLDQFFEMMRQNPNRAFYGRKHVEIAVNAMAVETLLVCDSLFRSQDLNQRKFYVELVDRVKDAMGKVRIFSTMHASGEQLMSLSGIAAILRFPLPEPESDDEDSDEDNESEVAPVTLITKMQIVPKVC